MSPQLDHLTAQALALQSEDRLILAQRLWESIESDPEAKLDEVDEAFLAEIERRDAEIASGAEQTFSHDDVMRSARQAMKGP